MSHTVFQQLAGTGSQQGPVANLTPIVQVRLCLLAAEISLAPPHSSACTYFHRAHQIYFTAMGVFWFCPRSWSSLKTLLCVRRSCSLLLASRSAPLRLKLPNPVLRDGVQTQSCTEGQDSSALQWRPHPLTSTVTEGCLLSVVGKHSERDKHQAINCSSQKNLLCDNSQSHIFKNQWWKHKMGTTSSQR